MQSTVNGSEVKRARESLGIAQTEVAAALAINRTYYSLFEAGRYLLDAEEQKRLADFFLASGHRLVPASDANQLPPTSAAPVAPEVIDADEPSGNDEGEAVDDVRLSSALRALESVRDTVLETGSGSKRTAAAVSAAIAVLETLDYPELLEVAASQRPPLAGLPTSEDFNRMETLEQRQSMEAQTSSSLVCYAIYGKHWLDCDCRNLRRAASELERRQNDEPLSGVRRSGFFGDDEKMRDQLRSQLAPHLASAASRRIVPTLTERAQKSQSGWGYF